MEHPELFSAMAAEAAQRKADILADALRRAEALRVEAEHEAGRRRDLALAEARKTIEAETRRTMAHTCREVERRVLVLQEAVVDEVIEKARADLAQLAMAQEFAPILLSFLEDALASVAALATMATIAREGGPPQRLAIRVPPRHLDACRAWLAAHDVDPAQAIPAEALFDGVQIEDSGRTVRVTDALSVRFARAREAARRLCLQRLFARGGLT